MKHFIFFLCIYIPTFLISQNTVVNINQDNIGINISDPSRYFHLEVPSTSNLNGIYSKINLIANSDRRALEGYSVCNPGWGVGGHFTGGYRGVYALGHGTSYSASTPVFGVYAESTGSAGIRKGVFGKASGGDENVGVEAQATGIGAPENIGLLANAMNGQKNTGISVNASGDVENIGLLVNTSGNGENIAARFENGDIEIEDLVRINSNLSSGRLHVSNSDNIGSNATAVRIDANNSGSEPTYGTLVTANNSSTGNIFGHYAQVYSTGSGTGYAFRAIANDPTDFAFYGTGNNFFSGDVRIGQNVTPYNGDYKVVVDGKILSEEVRVQNSLDWPDYVFDESYQLRSLEDVEAYINKHNHLPNIPSATEIEKGGIILGEMQTKMMEKIEELTLYIIAQQKEIDELSDKVNSLKNEK